jgi:hypothetical protein
MGREGSLVVPPKLNATLSRWRDLTKFSLRDATGKGSQRHSFRYVALQRLYPCSITGATGLGYLFPGLDTFVLDQRSPVQLGGPFGFCAFA